MTNINDPWPDDEVTRRLNDLPEVDPPSTMVQARSSGGSLANEASR